MTRVLSIKSRHVHAKAMRVAYGTKQTHPGPDCAYCRHSVCDGARFPCTLGHTHDAAACEDFRDTRRPSSLNPNQVSE
jgi:hypothetical protein